MADSYFTTARTEKYWKLLRAGDLAGLRRMKFGRILYNLRHFRSSELSQKQAAEFTELTRVQWNRIENGEALPRRSSITRIAKFFDVPAAILFRAAGYEVPEEHFSYEREHAHGRLDTALDESSNKAEFLIYMEVAWEEYQLHTLSVEVGLPERFRIQTAFPGLLAYIYDHLSIYERVQLAIALVQHAPHRALKRVVGDLEAFYESFNIEIEARMSEYVSPSALMTFEKDFIL